MKSNLIILIVLISVCYGFKSSNEVNISGKIEGVIPKKVYYSIPVNGVSYEGFKDSVKPDSLGNFHIKMNSNEPAFVILMVPGISSKMIVAEPGASFNISVNTAKKSESFNISGANEAGQNFYNTLPNPISFVPFPDYIQLEARKFYKDPSQDSIKKKISFLKANEMAKFKELLAKKEISQTYFNIVAIDRDCYYAALTATIHFMKYFMTFNPAHPEESKKYPLEMRKMWADVYFEYPINQKNLLHSHWWFAYAKSYIDFIRYQADSFIIQKTMAFSDNGLKHAKNLEGAKKYMTGQALEYYEAEYIHYLCSENNYEKEFISIYEQFKADFPKSNYKKYLDPLVKPIIEFHKIAEAGFDKNIKFIDNYDKANTLMEGVKSLQGKKIYVDVWATWCGPCKAEFEYKDNLIKLLRSKGIEILYISLDRDTDHKHWQDMIKYYNLQGNHIRANKQLSADLTRIYNNNGAIGIPWYILLDEKGNIIKNHAKKPSQIEELRKEIDELKSARPL